MRRPLLINFRAGNSTRACRQRWQRLGKRSAKQQQRSASGRCSSTCSTNNIQRSMQNCTLIKVERLSDMINWFHVMLVVFYFTFLTWRLFFLPPILCSFCTTTTVKQQQRQLFSCVFFLINYIPRFMRMLLFINIIYTFITIHSLRNKKLLWEFALRFCWWPRCPGYIFIVNWMPCNHLNTISTQCGLIGRDRMSFDRLWLKLV